MRARRALLYMPGDDPHKIRKATTLGVDCVCMDLEDGVAPDRKARARETVSAALRSLEFGSSERLIRINPVGSGLEVADLTALLPARPDGVVIPKVSSADQVRWVSAQIAGIERSQGWEAGAIGMMAIVESARGVMNLREITGADPRLVALIFGAEDLAWDLGAVRTPEGWEVFYARSAVVTAAAAFELQAMDMVYVDFQDEPGLRAEALQGAGMGFAGKQIIHPAQVSTVQEAFTPSEAAIAHARRIIEAYQQHIAAGIGAFALDGQMVDMPVVRAAERLLARARDAGAI